MDAEGLRLLVSRFQGDSRPDAPAQSCRCASPPESSGELARTGVASRRGRSRQTPRSVCALEALCQVVEDLLVTSSWNAPSLR